MLIDKKKYKKKVFMEIIYFNKIFNNTQNSYKYYWWLSITEICFQKDQREISYDEIIFKIISKLWYPVNYFKLSFGKIDQCSRYIKQIKENYKLEDNISEQDLYKFLLKHKNSDYLIKITSELTRYVPYRFIRPWYSNQTRGMKDGIVNSSILELQDESSPYKIDMPSKCIILNKDWFNWIKTNFKLIESFTFFELIKYLERVNPNSTNLSKKLVRPKTRNLTKSTKYWKNYILNNPNEIDIFEKKPLIEIQDLSIDHFLPWSFVAHDLIWNLHPTNKNINSSKNNCIPDKSYFNRFYKLQYSFCRFLLNINENKTLESYYTFFNCSKTELDSLRLEQFTIKMEKFYSPQYEIAKNMGFDYNWRLN